jgi:hypothetical protein
VFRQQLKAAAKFESAESHSRRITIVKRRDRCRGDFDASRRRWIAQHISQREGSGKERERGT